MRARILFLALLAFGLATRASAECYNYNNSSPTEYDFNDGGWACSGTGPGCRQCVDYWSNSYFQVCTYDWWGLAISCYSHGGPPENQTL
jgi:hypothetical protein